MKSIRYGFLFSVLTSTLAFANGANSSSSASSSTKASNQMSAGYNKSSGIELNNAYDVGISASFLYLQPTQDNMSIGFVAPNVGHVEASGTLRPINFDFDYKPGFKVGVNFDLNHDDWGMLLDYTWFHSKQTTSKSVGGGNYIYPTYGHPLVQGAGMYSPGGQVYNSVKSTWDLKLDFADLSLYRSFFVGKSLVFKTLYGIRGAWIRQIQDTHYMADGSTPPINPSLLNDSDTRDRLKITSWGVGPRAEIDTNWMFWKGLAFFGNMGADLLYTRYNTSSSDTQYLISNGSETGNIVINQNDLQFVRAHADMEFGLTYGVYFCKDRYHFDITAGYGFQVFWDQNMVWTMVTGTDIAKGIMPDGNLYLQGLRITVDFDF